MPASREPALPDLGSLNLGGDENLYVVAPPTGVARDQFRVLAPKVTSREANCLRYRAWVGRLGLGRLDSCASRKARERIRRPRPGSARRVVAHYGLDFEELLEPVLTPLATVARLLVAAERSPVIDGRAVQMHVAGANAPSDGLGAFRVA